MFATASGEGNLSLWDLEKEVETSISTINVGEALLGLYRPIHCSLLM